MRRPWVFLVVLLALVLAVALLSGPTGDQRGPNGTLALRRFLQAMGLTVRDGTNPPDSGVFVLLTDLRDPTQADEVVSWARAGGTVVVADPQSATAAAVGVGPVGRVGHYAFGPASLAPGCVGPEVAGVQHLRVDAADSVLSSEPGGLRCFPDGPGSFEVAVPVGEGRVVVLGGVSPLTNTLLARDSNAAFALGLFGSGGPVVFGPAEVPGAAGPRGLGSSLPVPARIVLLQLALAALVFALVRGRRFGRPVLEHIPSPVPASELVDAVASLYRSARARDHAARILRWATRRRLAGRLGMGHGASTDVGPLASAVAAASGTPAAEVERLLGGPGPASDEELIALGRELEVLGRRVEGS